MNNAVTINKDKRFSIQKVLSRSLCLPPFLSLSLSVCMIAALFAVRLRISTSTHSPCTGYINGIPNNKPNSNWFHCDNKQKSNVTNSVRHFHSIYLMLPSSCHLYAGKQQIVYMSHTPAHFVCVCIMDFLMLDFQQFSFCFFLLLFSLHFQSYIHF